MQVERIWTPIDWQITNDWDSHRPLLYLCVEDTKGEVVELGSGDGSTALLRKYCKDNFRVFSSYETNDDWANKVGSKKVSSYYEPLTLMRDVENVGLLFIDCAPGELRKDLIECYRDKSNIIIVHDTEESADYVYGMKEILSTFKYRLDFRPEGLPSTTAVSNFINIEEWIA